jgi:asparagine synthase (glutamine-hydrolysing)
MCGICGLVAESGPADPAAVERMNEALVHRGPDDGSVDAFGACVLGHRRLRVIDLETGWQPVADESGEVVCVFNGELYNFRELRAALAGHEIRGSGDTALLPHLYEAHGLDFVRRLHGMFALALWDARRGRLVLARDRVGKKPLLWTRLRDGSLAFASELKALLRLPGLRRELDPEALDAYLALQYVPGPRTALRGVEKVPAGSLLVFAEGRVRVERYWRLEPCAEQLAEDEWVERTRAAVTAAVRRRLVADVPVGALLSGGIDSSVVVAAMAQASPEPVRTFSVGFPRESDGRYDEREYARAVAARYGTVHEELVLEPSALLEELQRLAFAFDEPFGDEAALPTLLVCALARRDVTVALTGDGGDEAFGGYERYLAVQAAARVPAWAARVGSLLPRGEPRSLVARLARFADVAAAPEARRYGRLMEIFPAELRARLWEPEFVARPRGADELLGPPPAPGIAGLQRLDVDTYLPGDLLPKADLASMAISLELRSPFLDHEVLELGVSLPDSLRFRGRRGKEALRRAFAADLPPAVAGRGKSGFGVPLSRWFRGELREPAHALLLDRRARERGQLRPAEVERLLAEHESGRADHGHRLWCLLMLEVWQRVYVEAEPPARAADAPALVA